MVREITRCCEAAASVPQDGWLGVCRSGTDVAVRTTADCQFRHGATLVI